MSRSDWRWQQHHFRAMNTGVSAWWCGDGTHTPADIEELFATCEHSFSRFGDSAELVQLNRSPQPVCSVSDRLYAVLEAALWAARFTQGLYDPTLLDALEQAGYDRSFEMMVIRGQFEWPLPQPSLSVAVRQPAMAGGADWRSVHLLPELRTVRRPPGLRFDLGGIGKGWTVDRAADLLHGQGPYLVNAGGDLYVAGKPEGRDGWLLELEHPLDPQATLARLHLHDAALATSTIAKRRWLQGEKRQHHLIDPRTRQPAQTDALSVSVVAQRTALAEVLAKVALLLGAETGLDYLEAMPHCEGLVYRSDGQVLHTNGFQQYLVDDVKHSRRPIPDSVL